MVLELWADRVNNFRCAKKNSRIFMEMEGEMSKGKAFSTLELRDEIHNLTNRYKHEKKKMGSSGGAPSSWSVLLLGSTLNSKRQQGCQFRAPHCRTMTVMRMTIHCLGWRHQ
ncbi:uncharacterized protein LOC128871842 [Anastrepha ludens]|uniref:uncharacterized protein LOC128871842 n=1 Tax=Anastrepha ludens TaxID=28586 RepID=UPI0023AF9FB7|nr:uncharacterized protein LOC128871842 [Anastrepha ludens]XP_053969919.1 uncharacterized protein LOC128871842 [Anastrepha ludens]